MATVLRDVRAWWRGESRQAERLLSVGGCVDVHRLDGPLAGRRPSV